METNTTHITSQALAYVFQGETRWMDKGTPVVKGQKNFLFVLPDGAFLFVPSCYVEEKQNKA